MGKMEILTISLRAIALGLVIGALLQVIVRVLMVES